MQDLRVDTLRSVTKIESEMANLGGLIDTSAADSARLVSELTGHEDGCSFSACRDTPKPNWQLVYHCLLVFISVYQCLSLFNIVSLRSHERM